MGLLFANQRVLSVGKFEVEGLAVTADGSEFLTAGVDGLHRWDLATGKRVRTYRAESGYISGSVACSKDGRFVMAGFGDLSLQMWDFASGKELRQLTGHYGCVNSVSFSPDGQRALTSSGGHRGPSDPDVILPAPQGSLRVWDTASGKELMTITGRKSMSWRSAYSPTGEFFVAGGALTVYAASDGRVLHKLSGHTGGAETVAIAPDGKLIASAGRDRTVRVWGVRDGKEILCLPVGKKEAITFSADGRYVIGDSKGCVRAWEVKKGTQIDESPLPAKLRIDSLAVTSDGKSILAGCNRGTVVVWA